MVKLKFVAPEIIFAPLKNHWKLAAGRPVAAAVKVTLVPSFTVCASGCTVKAGVVAGTSTRTLSTRPKLKVLLSDNDANGSQKPTQTLLAVNVALEIVAKRMPSITQSTVLPRRETITSCHARPKVPGFKLP